MSAYGEFIPASERRPKCHDMRDCFAKSENGACSILNETYKRDRCPFCKKKREWTNGVYYPMDFGYAPRHKKEKAV